MQPLFINFSRNFEIMKNIEDILTKCEKHAWQCGPSEIFEINELTKKTKEARKALEGLLSKDEYIKYFKLYQEILNLKSEKDKLN